jgi:hypothetical protein
MTSVEQLYEDYETMPCFYTYQTDRYTCTMCKNMDRPCVFEQHIHNEYKRLDNRDVSSDEMKLLLRNILQVGKNQVLNYIRTRKYVTNNATR